LRRDLLLNFAAQKPLTPGPRIAAPLMLTIFPTLKSDPELHPIRHGLVFGFFNALTWQIALGTPLVLFAERLGATATQVGITYAFTFLLTPIQVVSTALIPKLGFKRVALMGWGGRSYFLIVPVVLAWLAPLTPQPWMVYALIASVFFFCLLRSVGSAVIMSWLYALIPENARGRYFASDQFLSAIAGVVTLLTCAGLFILLPLYTALLVQYGIALAGSALSYISMRKLPDAPPPERIDLRGIIRDTPRHLFGRSPFRSYLWFAVWYYVMATPIPPFAAYYLKVVPRLEAWQIMTFEVLRYAGVVLAAWGLRRLIDRAGSRPFFLVAFALYGVVALFWWFFLRNGVGGLAGLAVVYALVGIAATCWTVANLHYLPSVTPVAERSLMIAIHSAAASFLGGCAPVAWGWFLKTEGVSGPSVDAHVFQWFFVFTGLSATVLAVVTWRMPAERAKDAPPLLLGGALLRPLRALTYFASWIEQPGPRSWERRERGDPTKREREKL
jgi:MFS family permease